MITIKDFIPRDFISLAEAAAALDAQSAIDSMGGSGELYEQVLKKTVRLLPSHIKQMDVSIGGGDLAAFAVIAHGVKGTLGQIGALDLARLAGELETAAKAGDLRYCEEVYKAFRNKTASFCRLSAEAAPFADGAGDKSGAVSEDDKDKLFDALTRAGRAAAELDTLAAAEILAPFTGLRFGSRIDSMISRAADALDMFKPGMALAVIEELQKECEGLPPLNREDEAQ